MNNMRDHKEEGIFLKKEIFNEIIMYIQEVENTLEQISSGAKKRPLKKMPEIYHKLIEEGQNALNHIARGTVNVDEKKSGSKKK
jgi:hypothetical protein